MEGKERGNDNILFSFFFFFKKFAEIPLEHPFTNFSHRYLFPIKGLKYKLAWYCLQDHASLKVYIDPRK